MTGRRIAGWHALTIAALVASSATPVADAVEKAIRERPDPPPPPRPDPLRRTGRLLPDWSASLQRDLTRDPTPAELRAQAKRDRKAARRLELARREGR